MATIENGVLILTFQTAYDPFAAEIEQSLKESGIAYREEPVSVMHYDRGEGGHFLQRLVIPLQNIPAIISWLWSKGYQVFGKNIAFENPGLGKGSTRTIDEMETLIDKLTQSEKERMTHEARIRIAERAANLRLEQNYLDNAAHAIAR